MECKTEKEKYAFSFDSFKTRLPFNNGNTMPVEEFLNNNHYYNFGFHSNQNQYDYINLYLKLNMIHSYAYSSMLYDLFMKTKLPFLSSFNG